MLLDLPTAARYNSWANKRLYAVAGKLSDDELVKDRLGFFRSILGTLNHILLADLIYRERLEKKPTTFTRLDEILHADFKALETAQLEQDNWYVAFCEAMDPEELEGTLSFDTVETGEFFSLPLRMCLTNLFQHQIHHRGQTHHMLSHAGLEPPPLDVVQFGSGL
ncbi:MAG: damage-inducible protein DinB [Rhodospirillaceae bacterium]|nr:damage-inducible protein DinB [Rhodospirillaceae bacterium]|tara:strand:+ start:2657 stop:3151 length:495 start_codon:yes stop_codon:yes gene_type:complete